MKKGMKLVIPALLLALIIAGAAVLYPKLSRQYESAPPAVPEPEEDVTPAPDFTVYDAEGNAVRLSDQAGKPVIVNFWTTWCRYCVEELPDFDRFAAEYGDQISFMMVDLPDGYRETEKMALDFVETQGFSFPVYFDTDMDAAAVYRVQSIPMTLLVNSDGSLYQMHIGLMDEAALKGYIEILTGGK